MALFPEMLCSELGLFSSEFEAGGSLGTWMQGLLCPRPAAAHRGDAVQLDSYFLSLVDRLEFPFSEHLFFEVIRSVQD